MRRTVVRRGVRGLDARRDAHRPPEWPRARYHPRVYTAVVCAVVAGVFALVRSWQSVGHTTLEEVRFYGLLAVLMLSTAAFGGTYWWPGRGEPAVGLVSRGGRAATEVRSRLSVFVLFVLMLVFAVLLSLGAATEIALFNTGLPWVSVCLAIVALVCLLFLVEVALGRLRPGGLTLGPDGVRYRGWFVESYLPWMSVAGVRAVNHGYPETWIEGVEGGAWARRRTSRWIPFGRIPEVPRIEVDSRCFAAEPVLLHRILVFYASHPQYRAELGTEASLDRIRRADLAALDAGRESD